jgi:iron complex outermembrane recepter protein
MRFVAHGVLALWTLGAGSGTAAELEAPTKYASADLTLLSLDELAGIKVTSVSKRPEAWSKTAAAVHVITQEDLRRGGVTSLAEALRLVPGVHLARINSNQWGVGIRGFTSRLSDSQLALIDGRSVYTTLFAGTTWEIQDTLIEDVERIEVVRGPGGTLWGANAVNGIVNVITRSAKETQGGLVAVSAGNEERVLARARYGGTLGSSGHYRVYMKYADRDAAFHAATSDYDDWDMLQGGFRSDWDLGGAARLTVQGDAYRARLGERVSYAAYEPPFERIEETRAPVSGGHLLAYGTRPLGGGELSVRTYYDRTRRDEVRFDETRDTFDLDVQYQLPAYGRHEVLAGAGYRASHGRSGGVETFTIVPPDKTDTLASAFVEDRFDLAPERLRLSIGTKLEHNDYTGAELQPSARLLWTPTDRHSAWAAVTRAVRTPSRLERDIAVTLSLSPTQPLFVRLLGNPGFDSEVSWVYEAGYRLRPGAHFSVDVAAFYNRYPNLSSIEAEAPFSEPGRIVAPYVFDNRLTGDVSGVELAADARPLERWRLRADYAFLNMSLRNQPGSTDSTSAQGEDASPRHRLFVWSSHELRSNVDLDVRFRWLSRLPSQDVDAYPSLGVRLGWRPVKSLELALAGYNLLSPHHAEFGGDAEIERGGFAEVRWRW